MMRLPLSVTDRKNANTSDCFVEDCSEVSFDIVFRFFPCSRINKTIPPYFFGNRANVKFENTNEKRIVNQEQRYFFLWLHSLSYSALLHMLRH